MKPLPSSARVVVIGGGIGGCSVAYHLASLGVRDVVLLERSMLSSGTTWHSTGNMETYRADPLVFEMVRYAASCYPRLAQESGQEIGWRNVGRVMFTDREERWALMCTLPELGRARGIDIELMTPEQTRTRLPILATEDLIGAVWVPGDARVNPTDAVMAFAAAARSRGVMIHQDARVLDILVRDGAVRGVVTDVGTVSCDTIVVAAGLWSSEIVQTCGLRLPLHALEHQYLITQPLGIDRNLPLFLSYDDQLYGREEVGGLMIGSLDDHAIPLSVAELPQNFSYALLNERWEQFEPYMATAMRRFPLLRTAGIKMLLNGPESFTPDGQMLLGPVPGATGLLAACGFNSNGMALAPAAGRYIAEWIVEGEPSADVAPLDVRRFSPLQSTAAYMRERVTEIPGFHCRIHAADADYATARDIRHSPLHEQLVQVGARFASVNAWERPQWVAHNTSGAWLDAVAGEVRAATGGVLIIDRSADVKVVLRGATVREWLAGQIASPLPTDNREAATALLSGGHGQLEAMTRLMTWEPESFLLTACPEQEVRLAEWLRCVKAPHAFGLVDVTAAYALLEIYGPLRAAPIAAIAAASQGADGVSVQVREDSIHDCTLILVPAADAARVWRQLLESNLELGVRVGGHFANEALRIARGIPAFGHEATPARLTRELQSGANGKFSRPVPRTHLARVLVALSGPMEIPGFGSREVILSGDRPIGELTSRVRMPEWPAALALALLDPGVWRGESVELVSSGRKWPMSPRTTHWNKMRGV